MLAALKNIEPEPTLVHAKKILVQYLSCVGFHVNFEWARWYLIENGYLTRSDCDLEPEDIGL
jgi:hypothetical protein